MNKPISPPAVQSLEIDLGTIARHDWRRLSYDHRDKWSLVIRTDTGSMIEHFTTCEQLSKFRHRYHGVENVRVRLVIEVIE